SDAEHIEARFVRPDGTLVWGRTSAAVIRNPDRSVAYFISLTEDVTAQREAEAALHRRQRWFEALVEHATDVVCLLDGVGAIVWASPSAARVLGYPDGAYQGERFTELVHPDDRERVEGAFEEGLSRPGPAPPVE